MTDVVAVATSGGRDSVALLHATVRAASELSLRVVALHVHHGLQPQADRWLDDVRELCAGWSRIGYPVAFAAARIEGRPSPGDSIESWARRERYAALARMAREVGATLVLLAHHRQDQAETVLLQALRGAGPAGLAAMPKTIVRDGLTWSRPWLDETRDRIEAYAAEHGLPFVQDPSNHDVRWARSRLRTRVMPVLREAFPEAERAIAAVASRAHEAREVLDEVARDDLATLLSGEEIELHDWRRLSRARRANALRAWLASRTLAGVPETLLARLVDELVDDAPRRWPLEAGRSVRSWRGRLAVVADVAARSSPLDPPGPREPLDGETELRLLRCGLHDVPGWSGRLEVFAVQEGGIAPTRLAHVRARARGGGEQFRRAPRASDRSLKKQFQAAGVAPEARDGPLIFDAQGALLYVPGLGIDARAWAATGAPQWAMRWLPADDASLRGKRP